MTAAIGPVAGADMDSQFDHAFADGFAIAEIAGFDLAQSHANARRAGLVAKRSQPFGERFASVRALIAEQFHRAASL